MPDFRFTKAQRLLKSADFDHVFARRRSQADRMLIVYACENDVGAPRLGLVVSRKVGGAVVRNRWKRCLRDAFRLAQHELPCGLDLVVMPKPGATPTMPAVRQSLFDLAGRLARQLGAAKSPPEKESSA
jgi:ribonuclease P protein component